ncbi:hypothetical protein V6N12_047710 [Hibiscus sabdariffa]|uniref:Uncharacterized protein n=1 Tax=Hibiscus sabdariffa TaxID=183260 RepID=A0ABR2CTS6_9ROSI
MVSLTPEVSVLDPFVGCGLDLGDFPPFGGSFAAVSNGEVAGAPSSPSALVSRASRSSCFTYSSCFTRLSYYGGSKCFIRSGYSCYSDEGYKCSKIKVVTDPSTEVVAGGVVHMLDQDVQKSSSSPREFVDCQDGFSGVLSRAPVVEGGGSGVRNIVDVPARDVSVPSGIIEHTSKVVQVEYVGAQVVDPFVVSSDVEYSGSQWLLLIGLRSWARRLT